MIWLFKAFGETPIICKRNMYIWCFRKLTTNKVCLISTTTLAKNDAVLSHWLLNWWIDFYIGPNALHQLSQKIMPFFSLQIKQQFANQQWVHLGQLLNGRRYQTTNCKVKQPKALAIHTHDQHHQFLPTPINARTVNQLRALHQGLIKKFIKKVTEQEKLKADEWSTSTYVCKLLGIRRSTLTYVWPVSFALAFEINPPPVPVAPVFTPPIPYSLSTTPYREPWPVAPKPVSPPYPVSVPYDELTP